MPRLAVALLLLGSLLAGCGGGSSSGGDDPARAVPRDAALYVEATVRPEGGLRDDALAAAGKLLSDPDPAARIEQLVSRTLASADGPRLDYARDVEPWLGSKVGFWLAAPRAGEEPRGAAILAATDPDAAQEALDRAVERSDERFSSRTYEDVSYEVNQEGAAAAVVEDFVVLGTEAELRRTVDALSGSEALSSDDRYAAALGELPSERLAHFYFDVKALLDAALRQDPAAAVQFEQLRRVFPFDRLGPVAGAFTANGDRLAVDSVTTASGDAFERLGALSGTGGTPLLGELPGDAWFALGSPRLGETARELFQRFAGVFGGGLIAERLRSQLGIELERDVFSWVGDVASFARGSSPAAIDGGAVIEVLDAERARTAFAKLIGVAQSQGGIEARAVSVAGAETAFALRLPDAPSPVVAARSAERVVVAYGLDAAEAALSGDARLASTETFGEARSVLGEGVEPAFLLSMPPVVALLAGEPDFARARPYLEALTVLVSGGSVEGDTARSRVAVGLK